MTNGNRLRIGLAGAGMVSEHHLNAWVRIENANIVAIADPDLDRARRQCSKFGVGNWFESAEAMLEAMPIDAIDIAAPVQFHGEICRHAAKAGVHILCQKPLASTLVEAKSIVADVGDHVRFMVHENWRHRAHYRQIKTWLAQDRIGSLNRVKMTVRSSGLLPDRDGELPALLRQPFLANLPRLLVFEVLVHHIDVLRWLFGDLHVVSAMIFQNTPAVLGEDQASIRLRTADGRIISLEATLTDRNAPVHIADHLLLKGIAGTILLDDSRLELRSEPPEQFIWSFDELYADSYAGALREFTSKVLDNRPFESDANDNLRNLALVEEIYRILRELAQLRSDFVSQID